MTAEPIPNPSSMSNMPTMVNGVPLDRLVDTIEAVNAQPELAKFRFRVGHRWIDGAHAQSTIKDFEVAGQTDHSRSEAFVLQADEPDVLLGKDYGPNATEAALHALAACLDTTFIYHAAALGVKIDELELELEGDLDLRGFLGLDPKVRNGYRNIRVTFKVKSDAPQEKIEMLCKLAQKRSPVFDIVSNPVPVDVTLELQTKV